MKLTTRWLSGIPSRAGSFSAARLYHHTATANQVKETNSIVDIGAHWVAIDPATGRPYDYDADTLADYLEDVSNDGFFDPTWGETDWKYYERFRKSSNVVVLDPLVFGPGEVDAE